MLLSGKVTSMRVGYTIVEPVLDESAYGVPDTGEPRYAFYRQARDGRWEFITARSVPELVAVTPAQMKAWKGSEMRCYRDGAKPEGVLAANDDE